MFVVRFGGGFSIKSFLFIILGWAELEQRTVISMERLLVR